MALDLIKKLNSTYQVNFVLVRYRRKFVEVIRVDYDNIMSKISERDLL
jgi:hypothetical protein